MNKLKKIYILFWWKSLDDNKGLGLVQTFHSEKSLLKKGFNEKFWNSKNIYIVFKSDNFLLVIKFFKTFMSRSFVHWLHVIFCFVLKKLNLFYDFWKKRKRHKLKLNHFVNTVAVKCTLFLARPLFIRHQGGTTGWIWVKSFYQRWACWSRCDHILFS